MVPSASGTYKKYQGFKIKITSYSAIVISSKASKNDLDYWYGLNGQRICKST